MNILRLTLALTLLVIAPRVDAAELRLVIDGLTAPIGIADPNDGTGHLFIQEQQGIIQVLMPSRAHGTPLLDLRAHLSELDAGFEERGLLGFVLYPNFAHNGRVYISYSTSLRPEAPMGWNYTRKISELTLASGATTINPLKPKETTCKEP